MRTLVFVALILAPVCAFGKSPESKANAPEKATDKQDKIVCKTFSRIGSLVATEKVCHTKREWENGRANLYEKDPLGSCTVGGGICNM